MWIHKSVSAATGIVVCMWMAGTPGAFAQSGEDNIGEVAGLGGAAFGGASGTQPTVTGGAGVAFSRYGMALVETTFMPLGNHTIQNWPDRATVTRSDLLDFGVDFHIRIPVKRRLAPYAIAGTGLLWNLVRADTFNRAGVLVVRHFDEFNGALHTGAGLRYYIRENWGIRPEVKVIVSKQVYTLVSFGIFYVTPTNWP
jgi:Outer membrane protein beta-barrel domain